MNSPNPIQRFLGLPRATDSPFELLGLTVTTCDVQQIRSALDRRLGRVSRHRESQSHEADEVRLALHAAAAQLLDPSVREKLAGMERETLESSMSSQRPHLGFQDLARRVLARSGGWGKESQRWLALLAHAHGLDTSQLCDELRSLVTDSRSPMRNHSERPQTSNRTSDGSPPQTLYEEIHAPPVRRRRALSTSTVWLMSVVTVVMVIAVTIGLRSLLRQPDRSNPEFSGSERTVENGNHPGVSTSSEQSVLSSNSPPHTNVGNPKSAQVAQLPSPGVVIHWLELAQQELSDNPGQAAWRFQRASSALAATWTTFSVSDRTRANDLVLSILQRFQPGTIHATRVLSAVMDPLKAAMGATSPVTSESIRAAAWSAAVTFMFGADPDTVSAIRLAAGKTLTQAGLQTPLQRGSFEQYAYAALPALAQSLVKHTETHALSVMDGWSAWVDMVKHVALDSDSSSAPKSSDRLVLDAADQLLHSRAQPSVDPAARNALELLLSHARWSAGSQPPASWASLLQWFDEIDIDPSDLSVAINWLVRQRFSPQPGADMILSRRTSADARSELRDRYARLWGMDVPYESLGFATVWGQTVRQTLVHFQRQTHADSLALAAVMSRLNESAALRWRGDAPGARDILLDPITPIKIALHQNAPAGGSVRKTNLGRDGRWSVQYLSSNRQDVETRTRLLVELGRRSAPLGPIDADVVVHAALRSPLSELRTRAGEIVRRRAGEAGVVSALLDGVSQAPKNKSTTALIAQVTGRRLGAPTDSDWPVQVRRALVSRLLDMLAPSDESSTIDRLSEAMTRSYASRAGANVMVSGEDSFREQPLQLDRTTPSLEADYFSQVWMQWRDLAQSHSPNRQSPVSFNTILRHHRGRIQLAEGSMQRFSAMQVSIAEAMGFVISAERPRRARDIRLVIKQLSTDRRAASTILDQIIAAERAMLKLWGIRFGLMLSEVVPDAVSPQTPSVEENGS